MKSNDDNLDDNLYTSFCVYETRSNRFVGGAKGEPHLVDSVCDARRYKYRHEAEILVCSQKNPGRHKLVVIGTVRRPNYTISNGQHTKDTEL